MNRLKVTLMAGLCAGSLGCTKVNPNFTTLDQNVIPRPMFAGSTTDEIVSLTAAQTYAIQGQCDPRITALIAVGEGLNSAQSLDTMSTGIVVDCANTGTFSFTLNSLTQLGFTIVDNSIYVIELRAFTSGGISNPSLIKIDYSTTGASGPKRVLLTSGGTASSTSQARVAKGAGFSGVIRVDHMANSDGSAVKTTADSKFFMKSGSAAESD